MKIPFTASYLFYAISSFLLGLGVGGEFHKALYDIAKNEGYGRGDRLFIFGEQAYRFEIWKSAPGYALLEKSLLETRGLTFACLVAGGVCLFIYLVSRALVEAKAKKKKG